MDQTKGIIRKITSKPTAQQASFPIVAIGSSAGGLEAVSNLLKSLPADTGMAFIYVQHLSPNSKSLTTSLLSKQTKMIVQEIQQMELIKPNNLYVIPNNKNIQVTDGHIKLVTREKKESSNLSIDKLFISLSLTHTDEVIGVVLSGNANDGTKGLTAIKDQGGITFAQDSSAKNSSMPTSAISAGVVDFVLSPLEIALSLAQLGKHFGKYATLHHQALDNITLNASELKAILQLIHKHTGVDFSLYKTNTIQRRILRRMLLSNIKSVNKYTQLLVKSKDEVETLQQDLLINFTSFFRDPEAFEYLRKKILPKLLASRTEQNPLRIWTVACSTGEEAYSLAMLIQEVHGKEPIQSKIQIFATDLSVSCIEKSRLGIFSQEDLKQLSPQRIARFFVETPQGYRISKSIREMCIFAVHNVINEPPFSRLDLICCCNMLIYLDLEAQQKIMSIFHYSLNDNGILLLGRSETIGTSGYLFKQLHKKLKIFTARKHSSKPTLSKVRANVNLGLSFRRSEKPTKQALPVAPGVVEQKVETLLIDHYFPACVVVNTALEIILFRGKTSTFLENAPGKASLNILKMARQEIVFELRNGINQAIASGKAVKTTGAELTSGTIKQTVVIEIIPFTMAAEEPFLLVLFNKSDSLETEKNTDIGNSKRSRDKSERLMQQLAKLKADMILMSNNHEDSTQELQSANEEIVSANEELQSLNEELETSREEIESTNEELNATIQELLTQNQLLAESYRYSEDIIATLHEPMIVLDHELNVKTANASFYKFFNEKIEAMEGRSFYKVNSGRWDIPKLRTLLESILRKNSSFQGFPVKFRLKSKGEVSLLLNAKRIIQKSHKKNLILLAMADVTPVA